MAAKKGFSLTQEQLAEIEEKYDESSATREISGNLGRFIKGFAVVFAVYHFLTAGFGLPVDYWHMGLHLCGLFVLIFAFHPLATSGDFLRIKESRWRPGNVPIYDWVFIFMGCASALYVGIAWKGIAWLDIPEQTFRQGNPINYDIFFGAIMIVLVLEITRRALGWVLPLIILVFILYSLLGPYIPVQILKHPGTHWRQFINNMYFPAEGIYGITLWVVSTIVFHFVLFGIIAQKTGLGKLFIDNAMILAGRYVGGPAKVSVISSAFFGTISGSSVANTVSTGALTIPNMKRLGYPGHFAGGVEASSSAGGQITPPIMGAAAFIMAEFLELPYTTIVIAAIIPALMHYIGVFSVVHLMALKIGLVGFSKEQLPQFKAVWKDGWANIVPLIGMLIILFTGYTPYMAAFCGISLSLICGLARYSAPLSLIVPALFTVFTLWKFSNDSFSLPIALILVAGSWIAPFNPQKRAALSAMIDTVATGAKYALAVGAAAAAVGMVVGVINTTGVGFRIGFMVTSGAATMAESIYDIVTLGIFEFFSVTDLQLFLSLCLIAVACILMGAGIPTTALYIMLASVAQPALAQLGIPPIASHMFVLYYGVVSEITPPVCTSAYAAAAIANSNPFRTGLSAFGLGLGKVVAPMAFVYAPILLIVSPDKFDVVEFLYVLVSSFTGVVALSAAVVGYFFTNMKVMERILYALAGLIMLAPDWRADLFALLVLLPAFITQLIKKHRHRTEAHAAPAA